MSDILTPARVDEIARACLYRDEELSYVDGVKQVPEGAVVVEAITTLFALGQAIGAVTVPFRRESWPSLPGGVPYYTVKVDPS